MANDLREIQSWVYDVITNPESIQEGAKRVTINKEKRTIESVVAPSNELTSEERINIYRNSYFLRLLECFTHEFKGLHSALGDDMFNHFVWNYLQTYPSTSYTLNELGAMFPSFLQSSLEANLNGAEPDWWQLFIIDVAIYERAYVETYNGSGHESLESTELFLDVSLKPSPALRLLQLHFSIDECIISFRNNDFESIPDPKPTNYVLTRKNYSVVVHQLELDEFETLQNWLKHPEKNCPTAYETRWERMGISYPQNE